MRYFVDTNIWIFCLRGRSREAWTRLNAHTPRQIVLALQTFAELRLGVEKCARPALEQAKLQAMIAPYSVILPEYTRLAEGGEGFEGVFDAIGADAFEGEAVVESSVPVSKPLWVTGPTAFEKSGRSQRI